LFVIRIGGSRFPMTQSKSRIAQRSSSSGEARTRRHASSKAAPKTARAPRKRQRKFYVIESAWAGDFPYRILNDGVFADGTSLLDLPKEGRGFRQTIEPPIFHFIGQRPERDFWRYTFYWFISDRMKAFLEQFDPAAFEFLKCEIKLPDGTSGPVRWLCDVVRVVDALDEEKSRDIFIETDTAGQKYYLIGSGTFAFNEDAVGPHHVFLMRYSHKYVVGDEEFKLACKAAGLKGISFYGGGKG
jgi:uncharacterized protein DUF1629